MWVCHHPHDERVLLAEGWVIKCRKCKTCRFTVSGVGAIDPGGGDRWRTVDHHFPPERILEPRPTDPQE